MYMGFGYNPSEGAISQSTIERMKSGGASSDQIGFAQDTMFSMDPSNVAIHRAYINDYNPSDPYRQANNFSMHPLNYQFGPGPTSPESIGNVLSTLPAPMRIAGPGFSLPVAISPYVNFG